MATDDALRMAGSDEAALVAETVVADEAGEAEVAADVATAMALPPVVRVAESAADWVPDETAATARLKVTTASERVTVRSE